MFEFVRKFLRLAAGLSTSQIKTELFPTLQKNYTYIACSE